MTKALLLYSSHDGQTLKIMQSIDKSLNEYQCDLVDLHQAALIKIEQYDKVLIGASIRYGHLNRKLYQFIEENFQALERIDAAFFCVNLTARKEQQQKDTPQGSAYIKTFLKKSKWQPKLIGVFAGALNYPQYGFFDKHMIRLIMKLTGGETDTLKSIEYTNWEKVALFAETFQQSKYL